MNMQQIPSKMKDIRRIFTAGTDNYIISTDYSRQEPVTLTASCKDPALIDIFDTGLDIYSKIASMVYNVSYEECLEHNPDGTTNKEGKERRNVAKRVTLSIMYSKGLKTLAEDLHSDVAKAQEVMDAVLTAYPVMKQWMQDVMRDAIEKGYADNMFGRRRRWPEFNKPAYEFIFPEGTDEETKQYYSSIYLSKLKKAWFKDKNRVKQQIQAKGITVIDNEAKIAEAKRQIVNFFVQSAAAVITLRGMRNIYNSDLLRNMGCRLVMAVHDEVLVVCPRKYIKKAVPIIEDCMISAGHDLGVPLFCDTEVADRWYGEPVEVK